MDKLRPLIHWLGKYHFWLLGGIAIIVAVLCWYMSAAELAEDYKKKSDDFKTLKNAQQSLASRLVPNDDVNEGDLQVVRAMRDRVAKVWRDLYQRQQEHVLKWPSAFEPRFHETIAKYTFGQELEFGDQWLLERYRNYIEQHVDELPKMIQAWEPPEDETGQFDFRGSDAYGGAAGANAQLPDEDYLVIWHDFSPIRASFYLEDEPEPIEMWVFQENLWAYENLLQIIAKVNEAANSTGPHNSAIREIIKMEVGRPAAIMRPSFGRVQRLMAPGAAGGMEGGYGAAGGGYAGAEGGYGGATSDAGGGYAGAGAGGGYGGATSPDAGGYAGAGGGYGGIGGVDGGPVDMQTLLLAGRYLNAEGMPQPSADLESLGTEFKRLPIRLVLKMDQRWLNRLLVECANAALPVEVEQIRINPMGGAFAEAGAMGGDGYGGGGEIGPGSRRGFGGGYGGGGYAGAGGGYGAASGGYDGAPGGGMANLGPPAGRAAEGGYAGAGGGYGGAGGGYAGAGRGGYGGAGGGYGDSFGIGMGETADSSTQQQEPYLANVIIHATVYIYQKPTEEALKIQGDDQVDAGGLAGELADTDGSQT